MGDRLRGNDDGAFWECFSVELGVFFLVVGGGGEGLLGGCGFENMMMHRKRRLCMNGWIDLLCMSRRKRG